jgi:CheY-like chemotaxis protein
MIPSPIGAPLAAVTAQSPRSPALPATGGDGGGAPGEEKPFRILIVEDEVIAAMDLEAQLLRLGHEVVELAHSAPDAVQAACLHRPDLVLMDIRLARGTSGIDAATQIHDQLGIRSIFVTAHSDPGLRQIASAANPLDFVIKPYSRFQIELALKAAARRLRPGST